MPYSWPMLPKTTRAVDSLESAVDIFVDRGPTPKLHGPNDREWYQYGENDQTWTTVAVLKAVRIVSGLRATKRLGESGYTHEMGVLLRTVDDFIDEIGFLIEGFDQDPPSSKAQEFVENFFQESLLGPEELREDRSGPDRVRRKKIRAGMARLLGPKDWDTPRRHAMAIDDVYSGSVHGSYPAIMELYDPREDGFHMDGMENTNRIPVYRKQLAYYVYRALCICEALARKTGHVNLAERLRNKRIDYGESDEYPADVSRESPGDQEDGSA